MSLDGRNSTGEPSFARHPEPDVVYLLIPVVLVVTAGSAYAAYRSVDFRKFLAGAFLVSGGVQLYLAAAGVTVPVIGTAIVQPPDVGWVRGSFHLLLGVVAFYFGFVRRPART